MNATGGGVNASQTVSLNKKCQDLILKSACLPSVRENVLIPILEYLANDADPKLTLKDEPIKVMWHLFRQGSFMCELLNQVQPGVIQSVSLPIAPMGPTNFTDTNSRQNVAAFIKSSRDMFFMTDDELFNPGDMYKEDFNAFTKAMGLCETYLNNKIRVSSRNSYSVASMTFDPDIAHLFNIRDRVDSNAISSVTNSSATASDTSKPKRSHILEEMIASERVYVDDLARLNKYKEMIKFERLLSLRTIDSIFANLKDLLNFQRKFMIQMENEIQKEKPDFGVLFTLHEADFKLYEDFCLNHSLALEVLKKNKSILERRPDLFEGGGNIEGYLIKPIQRVTRYSLFMRDLNKEAVKSSDEVEIKSTEIALESVKRIAFRINERQRTAENERTSEWFFSHFHPKVLSPEKTGKLILHDKSLKLKLYDELKVYQVFLFQRKLIMCAEKDGFGAFWLKNKVNTNTITEVRDMETKGEADAPYEVEVTTLVAEKNVSFSMLFRTQQMQRMWINTIRGLAELPLIEFRDIVPKEPEVKQATAPIVNAAVVAEAPVNKTHLRINFRDEYFSIIVKGKLSLLDLNEVIRDEIVKAYRQEFKRLNDFPSIDRMRLRYKDEDGIVVRLTSDEVLEELLMNRKALDLIVYEGEPVRVRFTYRDYLYSFQVDDLSAIEELRIYVYETILEDYRMINANIESIPKGDAMRMFVREPDGEWSLMLYDNDLEVAMKLSDRKLEIKL